MLLKAKEIWPDDRTKECKEALNRDRETRQTQEHREPADQETMLIDTTDAAYKQICAPQQMESAIDIESGVQSIPDSTDDHHPQ